MNETAYSRVVARTAWATLTFQGVHWWTGAPEHRSYLSNPHRHEFHVRIEVPVTHDDRQLEFHDLKSMAREALSVLYVGPSDTPDTLGLGTRSCEAIASELGAALLAGPLQRSPFITVHVSEDGENGATVALERRAR